MTEAVGQRVIWPGVGKKRNKQKKGCPASEPARVNPHHHKAVLLAQDDPPEFVRAGSQPLALPWAVMRTAFLARVRAT